MPRGEVRRFRVAHAFSMLFALFALAGVSAAAELMPRATFPKPDTTAIDPSVVSAQEIVTRVNGVFDEWNTLREIEPDNERLANAAAVNRWELMRMSKDAEQLDARRDHRFARDAHFAREHVGDIIHPRIEPRVEDDARRIAVAPANLDADRQVVGA